MSSAIPFVSGDVLSGRYEFDRRVAQGGLAEVWRYGPRFGQASCHQAAARRASDDVRTDLYSLGILAYQCLAAW